MGGIKLGKILGFQISIDWSWLLIFALVVYTLAAGYFPTFYPGFTVATNWAIGVLAAVLLFASVLVHELSHSVVARRYGSDVKGITLFLFGGVSQTSDEPKTPKEEFWMALVGPLTSLALAGLFYVIGGLGATVDWPGPVVAVLGYLAMINLLLAVFNLVPGFPLDGGRVFRSIVWHFTDDLNKATRWASYGGQGFGFFLMGIGFLNILGGNLIGGLWLIFIGWFLTNAARNSYQQLIVRQALAGVPVEQVMTTEVPTIPVSMPVRDFVEQQLMKADYSCYPVVRGESDDVIGVIGIEEVRRVSSDEWDGLTVGDLAHQIDGAYKIEAGHDAIEALSKLSGQEGGEQPCRLMVMENGHLKGTIGRDTMFRLVQRKMQLGM